MARRWSVSGQESIIVRSETITAYVGLGSNVGDRAGNLVYAIRGLLEASFELIKLSGVYETEPIEIENAPPFLNMVAEIRATGVTPSQMMARMLRIEYLLGRKEKSLKKPRTIDLDLLFFGDHRIDTPFLTVPHPRAHIRNFVLVPMAEIAPYFVHPSLNKTIDCLLTESVDDSSVIRWSPVANSVDAILQNG